MADVGVVFFIFAITSSNGIGPTNHEGLMYTRPIKFIVPFFAQSENCGCDWTVPRWKFSVSTRYSRRVSL